MTEPGPLLVQLVLVVPACGAAVLALFPDNRLTGWLNALAALITFLASAGLFFVRPAPSPFLIVDEVNVVFIVLTTFVGFTTSVFSASYIAHELDHGRSHVRLHVDDVLHHGLLIADAVRGQHTERLPVQVHGVRFHAVVPQGDTHAVALPAADGIRVGIALAVDSPDVATHHPAAECEHHAPCLAGRDGKH